jgi:hypothetical protein
LYVLFRKATSTRFGNPQRAIRPALKTSVAKFREYLPAFRVDKKNEITGLVDIAVWGDGRDGDL